MNINEQNFCGVQTRRQLPRYSNISGYATGKRNFVLIDVKVGLLLTFLASMKAKVRLYQKYVSVFGCLHVKRYRFSSIRFKVST